MAAFTTEQVVETGAEIVESLGDDFQLADLFIVVPRLMEIVERVEGMSGAEKEATAINLLDYVIDNTDTPWLPDAWTDGILKKGFRMMIPIVASVAKGEFKINAK